MVKAHFVAVEVSACIDWEGETFVLVGAGNCGSNMPGRAMFHSLGISPIVKPFHISTAG